MGSQQQKPCHPPLCAPAGRPATPKEACCDLDVGPAGWHQAGQDWWHGLNLAQISVLAQPMGEGPRGAEGPLWSAFPGKCLLVGEIKLLFSESLSLETPACMDTHARPGATEHPERHVHAHAQEHTHRCVRRVQCSRTHLHTAHSHLQTSPTEVCTLPYPGRRESRPAWLGPTPTSVSFLLRPQVWKNFGRGDKAPGWGRVG